MILSDAPPILDSKWIEHLVDGGTKGLEQPGLPAGCDNSELTAAMVLTWLLREDLQAKLDLTEKSARLRLIRWCKKAERSDHSLHQRLVNFIRRLASHLPIVRHGNRPVSPGVNLIGYGRGVLGMGEHVRMVGRAMQTAEVPNGIVDFTPGLGNRVGARDETLNWQTDYKRQCNLLHINADQMNRAYWHIGSAAFRDRYTIGYWAWELASFPDQWRPAIGFVDELWAPSEFIRQGLAAKTKKPVVHMPLCVELPEFEPTSRAELGIAEGDYVFAFAFDCHSFIARKNPQAIVNAFRTAFPDNQRARLVIKAMNADACRQEWNELCRSASGDPRISIIDATWPRAKLLSLIKASDCYVSLHRCEGFGRGPAEAMLMGKPVIVTDYSGTQDYCNEDNALLVRHTLVPVPNGDYPCSDGQVWADPDIGQAASHMNALFSNPELASRLGRAGMETIKTSFCPEVIGKRYAARLRVLGLLEGNEAQ